MKNNFICVILAGGKGTRLDGKGKLNQIFNGKTLLEIVFNRIRYQFSSIAVNIKNKNTNFGLDLEIALDEFSQDIGPLAGIHAAISLANKKVGINGYVFTVPVDTPFLPKDLAKRLYKNMKKYNSDVEFAKSGKRTHPTVGLWKNTIKSKLESSINNGIKKIDKFTSKLKFLMRSGRLIK